jgi:hypothetical protein
MWKKTGYWEKMGMDGKKGIPLGDGENLTNVGWWERRHRHGATEKESNVLTTERMMQT